MCYARNDRRAFATEHLLVTTYLPFIVSRHRRRSNSLVRSDIAPMSYLRVLKYSLNKSEKS